MMVDFHVMRVRKVCERLNPPSYADKVPNCSFPHCDEGEACQAGNSISFQLRSGVADKDVEV